MSMLHAPSLHSIVDHASQSLYKAHPLWRGLSRISFQKQQPDVYVCNLAAGEQSRIIFTHYADHRQRQDCRGRGHSNSLSLGPFWVFAPILKHVPRYRSTRSVRHTV